MEYFGMDLHQKYSEICELSEAGMVTGTARIPTTRSALLRWFGHRERARICIEASGTSPWVDRLLRELGHEVVVCNPHRVRLIAESTLKNDRIDAETLARLVRMDPQLLRPIRHRQEGTQRVRGLLKVRRTLVKSRTACINGVRGLLKSFGYRLPKCDANRFATRMVTVELPPTMRQMVAPLVATVADLSARLSELDQQVQVQGHTYPEVKRLQQVPGVGPVVALAFVMCLEDPQRFKRSRDVAGFLGLRPQLRASASSTHQGRITKQGDREMRRLLLQAAHAALRTRQDSALKSWGLTLMGRIGKQRALVALARKLAVVMHRLWITGAEYESFPGQAATQRVAA